jgi:hypothetical protein
LYGTHRVPSFLSGDRDQESVPRYTVSLAVRKRACVYPLIALARKFSGADQSWGWQWVFPSVKLSTDPRSGEVRRYRLNAAAIGVEVAAGVQELLGHERVETTMFDTHVLNGGGSGRSALWTSESGKGR